MANYKYFMITYPALASDMLTADGELSINKNQINNL